MVEILGVVKLVPVPNAVPPVAEAYQLIVPELAEACNVTVPELHTAAGIVLVILGVLFIVAVTAVLEEVHVPFVVST